MEEIIWSAEWEKKLGTIENVHPTKRTDLMMPYSKSDCHYCGHSMVEGETVLLTMSVHPEHIYKRFKESTLPSNFVNVELMHPMCLAQKTLNIIKNDNRRKEYIANV